MFEHVPTQPQLEGLRVDPIAHIAGLVSDLTVGQVHLSKSDELLRCDHSVERLPTMQRSIVSTKAFACV